MDPPRQVTHPRDPGLTTRCTISCCWWLKRMLKLYIYLKLPQFLSILARNLWYVWHCLSISGAKLISDLCSIKSTVDTGARNNGNKKGTSFSCDVPFTELVFPHLYYTTLHKYKSHIYNIYIYILYIYIDIPVMSTKWWCFFMQPQTFGQAQREPPRSPGRGSRGWCVELPDGPQGTPMDFCFQGDFDTGWGPPVMWTLVYKPWNHPH